MLSIIQENIRFRNLFPVISKDYYAIFKTVTTIQLQ